MPRPKPVPGTSAEWISRAQGSLAQAKQPKAEAGYWEDLCFLAQQAAEKAIKAVYQQHEWPFQYTHDIEVLLGELESHGIPTPGNVKKAVTLTKYAFRTRYPGMSEPVTKREYQKAVRLAEHVVLWAETLLNEESGLGNSHV